MTQQASPEPITLIPPATLDADLPMAETDPATVVESYADSLMDELFDDVDRILAGDDHRKAEVEYFESASGNLPIAKDEASKAGLAPLSSALDVAQNLGLNAESTALATKAEVRKQRHWLGKALDRLLVGMAGASLVFTGVFWLAHQQRQPERLVATIPEAAMTPEALKAEADAQFLKYLERSLEVIDDQIQASMGASTTATASLPSVRVSPADSALSNASIPPGGASGNASLLSSHRFSSQRPNVIERVYIPVYQPPSSQTLPALSNPATRAAHSAASGSIPNIAPISVHVLVGILELGDRSAALFEINGNPQRFYIGENISSSGWTLVSVANQEAVIRRNGEVRSVYVGQQF